MVGPERREGLNYARNIFHRPGGAGGAAAVVIIAIWIMLKYGNMASKNLTSRALAERNLGLLELGLSLPFWSGNSYFQ